MVKEAILEILPALLRERGQADSTEKEGTQGKEHLVPKVARQDSRGKRALDSRAQIAKMFSRQCAEGAVEPCLTPMTRSGRA